MTDNYAVFSTAATTYVTVGPHTYQGDWPTLADEGLWHVVVTAAPAMQVVAEAAPEPPVNYVVWPTGKRKIKL